jgi:hypothetical protein
MSTREGALPRKRAYRLGAWLLHASLLAWCVPAAAQGPMSTAAQVVEVAPPLCKDEAFAMVPFLDALRVELAGRGLACCTLVEADKATINTQALRVNVELVTCAPDAAVVRIGVVDSRRTRASEREISLVDVTATARPRALALATAELIRSFGQMPAPERPAILQLASSAPSPSKPEEPGMAFRMSLHGEGQVRLLPTRNTTLWGGRLRLSLPGRNLYAQLDLGVDYASAQTELGRVSLRGVSLGLGGGLRLANRLVIFGLGPRFELGQAWIEGETKAADVRTGSGVGVFSCLGLRASLEAPSGTRLRPGLALEGGGVLHGVRGESDGRTVVGITGYYLIGAVAIAFSL